MRGFTLLEMLTVIAIVGILVALAAPTIKNFRKGDASISATKQLLDDVHRARQLAISQRSTVYMGSYPHQFLEIAELRSASGRVSGLRHQLDGSAIHGLRAADYAQRRRPAGPASSPLPLLVGIDAGRFFHSGLEIHGAPAE